MNLPTAIAVLAAERKVWQTRAESLQRILWARTEALEEIAVITRDNTARMLALEALRR